MSNNNNNGNRSNGNRSNGRQRNRRSRSRGRNANNGRRHRPGANHHSPHDIDYPTPISIEPDFEQKDLPKLTLQNAQGKQEVYVSTSASKESFLYALLTYETAVVYLDYDVKQKIAGLRAILDPSLHDVFTVSLATLNINLAGAGNVPAQRYNQMVDALKRSIFTEYDRAALCQYLSRGRPSVPASMGPRALYLRLQTLRSRAAMMPGNDQLPSAADIHTTFFVCQPAESKRSFYRLYALPSHLAREALIAFMERQSRFGNSNDDNNQRSNDDNSNGDADDNSTDDDDDSNDNNRHVRRRTDARLAHHCPVHPQSNHSWSQCMANPRSSNFDLSFVQRLHDRVNGSHPQGGSDNSRRSGGSGATNAQLNLTAQGPSQGPSDSGASLPMNMHTFNHRY
jgi:hypothetical protein